MAFNKGQDVGVEWPQILAIIGACLAGITSAFQFTWTSPFLLVLINDKEHYDISEEQANLLPVFLPLGIMVGSIFFFKIHDTIGRKNSILLLTVPHVTFWVITIFARNIYIFYAARFLCGISDAIVYAALPMYIGEVATPRVRGVWGTGPAFTFNAGFLIINIIGSYFTIQQTAYICLTLPIISAILFLWMPESPYYYLIKGREEKARASLQWLLRKDNIEPDFLQLKSDIERQISETGTWLDLLRIKSNRKALTASLFLRGSQQFAGIAIFETYIQYIFDKSTSDAFSPQVSSIIFAGLLWLVMAIFALFLDKMGRRKAFMYSAVGTAIVLLGECIYFYLDECQPDIDLSRFKWYPLAGLIVYIIVYCVGLGPIPSLMMGEIFSASIKAKAISATNVGFGIVISGTSFLFQSLTNSVGLYAPFLVFSIVTFIGVIVAFYVIPETKGRTLEEIQQELKGNRKGNKV